jgi:hypothetical protein
MSNEISRRNNVDLFTPAEKAIFAAMAEVEMAGADTLLTEAVILLQQAMSKVSDFIDADPKNKKGNEYLASQEAVAFRDQMIDRFDDMAHTGKVAKQPLDEYLKAVQLDAWCRGYEGNTARRVDVTVG